MYQHYVCIQYKGLKLVLNVLCMTTDLIYIDNKFNNKFIGCHYKHVFFFLNNITLYFIELQVASSTKTYKIDNPFSSLTSLWFQHSSYPLYQRFKLNTLGMINLNFIMIINTFKIFYKYIKQSQRYMPIQSSLIVEVLFFVPRVFKHHYFFFFAPLVSCSSPKLSSNIIHEFLCLFVLQNVFSLVPCFYVLSVEILHLVCL